MEFTIMVLGFSTLILGCWAIEEIGFKRGQAYAKRNQCSCCGCCIDDMHECNTMNKEMSKIFNK